ncbi:MAG: hypothetical protein HQK64_12200 [Desulfamplus sp.]|nr:hypothetical protein [Desulfamplus sp.]
MNQTAKIFVCYLLFFMFAALPAFSADTTPEQNKQGDLKSPSVFFPEPVYQFTSSVEGEDILHDFVIMNKGTDILKVEKVKTG